MKLKKKTWTEVKLCGHLRSIEIAVRFVFIALRADCKINTAHFILNAKFLFILNEYQIFFLNTVTEWSLAPNRPIQIHFRQEKLLCCMNIETFLVLEICAF